MQGSAWCPLCIPAAAAASCSSERHSSAERQALCGESASPPSMAPPTAPVCCCQVRVTRIMSIILLTRAFSRRFICDAIDERRENRRASPAVSHNNGEGHCKVRRDRVERQRAAEQRDDVAGGGAQAAVRRHGAQEGARRRAHQLRRAEQPVEAHARHRARHHVCKRRCAPYNAAQRSIPITHY